MATMPRGATLIDNAISVAPGFTIGNVHVMAGVPRIMQAMFDSAGADAEGGPPIVSRAVHAMRPAGRRDRRGAGGDPGALSRRSISAATRFTARPANGVAIVAKGTDAAAAEAAIAEVTALMRALGGEPVPGEPPA